MFFQQLHALAKRAGGSVTITVAQMADSEAMTVVVAPKGGDKADPALATPLVLTATPQEFDAPEGGFLDALAGYAASHRSLMEQAEATAEVLKAAKDAQVQKGATATSKATGKATPKQVAKPSASARSDGGDDDDTHDDDGDGSEGGGDAVAVAGAPAPSESNPAPALFG
jgi:PRTRC genetic system protein E